MPRHPGAISPAMAMPRRPVSLSVLKRLIGRIAERPCDHEDAKRLGPCWYWEGYKDDKGYGQVHFSGRTVWVHRLMYVLYRGDLDDAMQVDHECLTPSCCNPWHLRPKTHGENSADANRRRAQEAVPF